MMNYHGLEPVLVPILDMSVLAPSVWWESSLLGSPLHVLGRLQRDKEV